MNTRKYWQDKTIVDEIVTIVQKNQIVAGTSDTIIGLIAPLTQKGFDTLNRLKERSDKPYLVLVAHKEQADQFTDALKKEPLKTVVENCWPGPLTLIVSAKDSVPSFATSASKAIALRVPNHPGLQEIASRMGGIFSTSANPANQPVPQTIDELDPTIKYSVALLIDDHNETKKNPSTILDCTGNTVKIIREGAYTKEILRDYLPTLR
ncbi:Sua5/YciO/YrdC/YwlC family protein [Candidatus Dependentiae bacterium]|nr:MAG: Sua5/YciO/YrdC/YwlC family protein [Candidatus Dependentiae bacterium]